VITDNDILSNPPVLADYKVVILADCGLIKNKVYEKLSQFANDGGCLIANSIPNKKLNNRYKSKLKNMILFQPNLLSKYHKNSGMGPVKEFPFSAEGKSILDSFKKILPFKRVAGLASLKTDDGKDVSDCEVRVWTNGDEKYLGIIRSPKVDLKPLSITAHLRSKYYVKSLFNLKNSPLILMDKIHFTMKRGDVKLFLLTKKQECSQYTVALNQKGKNAILDFVSSTPETTRIICVRVKDPKGEENKYYSSNVVLKNGQASYVIPFALNDHGEWSVTTKDAVSGETKTIKISL
jgi:hypothetical protein